LIRAEHYPYLVIERRDEAKAFEPEFLKAPAGFEEVKERSDTRALARIPPPALSKSRPGINPG